VASHAAKSSNKRRSVPGPEPSPLLATPRKASQPQPYASRAWRTPPVEARPANLIACALCGEPVLKCRRRHCEACMPKARREHGLRAIEAARKALAAQTAAGYGPRRSRKPRARKGDQRGASPQSPLGTRAPGPARRGVVRARDRAKARRLLAAGDRRRGAVIAHGLLAHPSRCKSTASEALGDPAQARRLIIAPSAGAGSLRDERSERRSVPASGRESPMSSFALRRYVFSISAAVALLAGCGGPQPPIGAPGVMPQSGAIATHVDRGWVVDAAASPGQ
jgi:hypothetical protein